MQEKPVEQVRLFLRDQITGRHLFNREALLALGINPTEAQSRGFQISLKASALGSRKPRNEIQPPHVASPPPSPWEKMVALRRSVHSQI
jgi:hypothetical protein